MRASCRILVKCLCSTRPPGGNCGVDRVHDFKQRIELMRRTKRFCSWRLSLASAVVIASVAGCASVQSTVTPAWTPTQTAGTAQIPRVEDCAIVGISSPTKYACNGKVYTSFQLAKLRMDEEKKYAAGR